MTDTSTQRPDLTDELTATLRERILVIDGAMGTMIQAHTFDEAGFRGERFADWDSDVRGNSDLLSLSQPDVIRDIHRAYLEAGADIVATNTFSAQRISQADYGMEELAYEMNKRSAELAREAADEYSERTPDRKRYVAGGARPDQPHRVDLAGRQRPRLPQHHLRRAGRGLPGAGGGPGRRRSRPAPGRDDLRHPQREGRDLRARDALRGARPALAGDHLRHHHRRVRAHPVRPGHRGVLELGAPRATARGRPQLRPRRRRRSGPTSPSSPGSPTASSPATPTPGCPTRSGSTTRRRTRWPR